MSDQSENMGMIQKIEALLRKAESTQFDAERELYMAKVDELILKYEIDVAVLYAAQKARGINEKPILIELTLADPYEMAKGILLNTVMRHQNCQLVRYRGYYTEKNEDGAKSTLYKAVGFESDLNLVKMLFSSLLLQCQIQMVRDFKTRTDQTHAKTWRQDYYMGFANEVGRRFAENRRANMEKEDVKDFLPVLHDRKKEVDNEARGQFGQTSRYVVRHNGGAGYHKGVNAGSKADIGNSRIGNQRSLGR